MLLGDYRIHNESPSIHLFLCRPRHQEALDTIRSLEKATREMDIKNGILKNLEDRERKAKKQKKMRDTQAETTGLDPRFDLNLVQKLKDSASSSTSHLDTHVQYNHNQLSNAMEIAELYENTDLFSMTNCYHGESTSSRVFSGPLVGLMELGAFVDGLTALCEISEHDKKRCPCRFRINVAKAVMRISNGSVSSLSEIFESAGGHSDHKNNASAMLKRIAYVPMTCFRVASSGRSVYDAWRVVDSSVKNPETISKILNVVHPLQPSGGLPSISVHEFRAIRRIASGETNQRLMNLLFMKFNTPKVNRSAFGSQWRDSFGKLESDADDALAVFKAYDEQARAHVLYDAAIVFPHKISDAEIIEEMKKMDADDDEVNFDYGEDCESEDGDTRINEGDIDARIDKLSDTFHNQLQNIDPSIECQALIKSLKEDVKESFSDIGDDIDVCGEHTAASDSGDTNFDPDNNSIEDLMKDAVFTSPSILQSNDGGRALLTQRIAYYRRRSLINGRATVKKLPLFKRDVHNNRKRIETIYPDIEQKVRYSVSAYSFIF